VRRCHRFSATLAALFVVAIAAADDGYWAYPGGGSWADPGNWDSGAIADGTDNTAYFGLSLEPTIPANATFTLDGARTIGNLFFTAPSAPDNWTLNTGSGGPLTLDATFDLPAVTVAAANQQVAVNAGLAGTAGLEKLGDGTLVLAAANTYSGPTLVSAGVLRVNGQVGADGITVAAGYLEGAGVIGGPVVVQSGATLYPSNSLGTLSLSNMLTLQAGSTTLIEVNAATSGHDTIQGMSGATYGGTLVVTNLDGTLAVGQSFPVFHAASASGDFASITPKPAAGLRWRFDPGTGVLSVASTASQPGFANIALAGTNVVMRVTNGPPSGVAYVLASTNVALPRTNWTRLATNAFDVSGDFTFTNAMTLAAPHRFYLISAPVVP